MKLRLYMDWWPGMENWKPCNPYTTTEPGIKSEGTIRLSFEVEIPEQIIGLSNDVDIDLPAVIASIKEAKETP